MKIEYRRLTLDYFLQNLLLSDKFQESVYIMIFFNLDYGKIVNKSRQVINKETVKLQVVLLNKRKIEVEVNRHTEAEEI